MAGPNRVSGLIPMELELRERLGWFIWLRWFAAAGIIGGALGISLYGAVESTALPLYVIGVGVALYNGICAKGYDFLKARSVDVLGYRVAVFAQMGLDWGTLALLVHYAGGIYSPMPLLLTFHVIIGALLLSQRACYALAAIGTLLVGALAFCEETGVWAPLNPEFQRVWGASGDGTAVFRWVSLSSILFVTAFLASSIAVRLREKEQALYRSGLALNQAYTELKALNEEKAWFVRTTTHQLRGPLATIQGLLEALPYAGTLSAKQAELIDRCRRRISESLDLIHDLLELASAQRPAPQAPVSEVGLFACLTGTFDRIFAHAAVKGVSVEVRKGAVDPLVRAPAEDVERIFSNLLENAVKYTPSGGRVMFEAAVRGDRVCVSVSDTGIGIDSVDYDRIFEGFFRTAAAKASGEMGTGLGLSIVKQLVTRCGGTVSLESAPGKGSRFDVCLPAG